MKDVKHALHTLFLLLICSELSIAQPVFSPEIRAKRETQWMKDSLHLNEVQLTRAATINLNYQRDMDRAAESPNKSKLQKQTMQVKDKELKTILTREQYPIYYRREQMIRKRAKIKYTGPHQPL